VAGCTRSPSSASTGSSSSCSCRLPENELDLPPEDDALLGELLAPLVAEKMRRTGSLRAPEPIEEGHVFAAINAASASCASKNCIQEENDPRCGPWSHFAGACAALSSGERGFRCCTLVADKLGVSIRCADEDNGQKSLMTQIDFPWSSISDVQEPRQEGGPESCTVTLAIREPTRLSGGPAGALALTLRLPSWKVARRFADTVFAFKAFEAQRTLLSNITKPVAPETHADGQLLLDETGCAFWALDQDTQLDPEDEEAGFLSPVMEAYVMESCPAPVPTPCCTLCWC